MEYCFYAEKAANRNALFNFTHRGYNDSASQAAYYTTEYGIDVAATGLEDGYKKEYVIIDGVKTPATTIGDGGLITFHLLPRFEAQLAAGGIGYAQFETGYNTGVYAYQFGAGTTVPADTSTAWSGAAIFTDGDATGVNRTWINIGNSSSSAFRRLAYWDNAAAYTVGAYTPTRTLDPATATLTDALNLLATLLNDINIT